MSEIQTTNWSETAASNNAAVPDGAPEGWAPSGVNNWGREQMAALKRDWNRARPTVTSAGTDTITLTYTTAPPAYVRGMLFCFLAGGTTTGAATLNVNTLGAKSIKKGAAGSTALGAGDIAAGGIYLCHYDGTNMQLVNPGGSAAGTVTSVATGNGLSGGPITASGTLTIDTAVVPQRATVTSYSAAQYFAEATLTHASPTTWNLATAQNGVWTITASVTLSNPTNMAAGQSGNLRIVQGSGGSKLITWGSAYLFPGSVEPTLSTAAGAVDLLSYYTDGTSMYCALNKTFG